MLFNDKVNVTFCTICKNCNDFFKKYAKVF